MIKVQSKKRLILKLLDGVLAIIFIPFNILFLHFRRSAKTPSSFLIVRVDHIGDAILSTPVYRSLKEKYPEAKITVICGSWAKEIFSNNKFIDETIIIDCPWWTSIRSDGNSKSSFIRQYYLCFKKIRKAKYDVFIDLRGDIRHIFLFGWLPRIPMRISYTRTGGRYLLTHPFEHLDNMHEIDRSYVLLKPFEPLNRYHKLEMFVQNEVKDSLIAKMQPDINIESEKYIVLFNGGRSPLRRMLIEKLIRLCETIINKYSFHLVFVGSSDEVISGNIVSQTLIGKNILKFHNLCGKLSFAEIKVLIEYAALYIGTDSSITHLSATTDTPSLAIYGPMEPDQVRPIGPNKTFIYHRYPCSPCFQSGCAYNGTTNISECINTISTDEIIDKLTKILDN